MAHVHDVNALFVLLFPDIPVVYANETTIDEAAMSAVPQWLGLSTLIYSLQHRMIAAVRTTVPSSHSFNSEAVMSSIENTNISNQR